MSASPAARRRRQLATLDALIREGTIEKAAHVLGIDPTTARRRIAAYCAAEGFESPLQAVVDRARHHKVRISGN